MKRNWDTIRDILIRLEEMPPEKGSLRLSDFPEGNNYEYSYHTEILIESGLIYGNMSKTIGGGANDFIAIRLTWDGHEFIDGIRSDKVWEKAKKSFVKDGLSMTLDLVKSVATEITSSYLKASIGS